MESRVIKIINKSSENKNQLFTNNTNNKYKIIFNYDNKIKILENLDKKKKNEINNIIMKYNIKDNKNKKIFILGKSFVHFNRIICKLIIENKLYNLREKIDLSKYKNN